MELGGTLSHCSYYGAFTEKAVDAENVHWLGKCTNTAVVAENVERMGECTNTVCSCCEECGLDGRMYKPVYINRNRDNADITIIISQIEDAKIVDLNLGIGIEEALPVNYDP